MFNLAIFICVIMMLVTLFDLAEVTLQNRTYPVDSKFRVKVDISRYLQPIYYALSALILFVISKSL